MIGGKPIILGQAGSLLQGQIGNKYWFPFTFKYTMYLSAFGSLQQNEIDIVRLFPSL